MNTTVDLQAQFSYAKWPMEMIGIMIIICVGALVFPEIIKLFKPKTMVATDAPRPAKQTKAPKTSKDLEGMKQVYLAELDQLEAALAGGSISTRDIYKKMSSCVRRFVSEVTGTEVTNYTLQDIKSLGIPVLEELISEYYIHEFAADSVGDSMESLQKTKRAIERWN